MDDPRMALLNRYRLFELSRAACRISKTLLEFMEYDRFVYLGKVVGQQQRLVQCRKRIGWRICSSELLRPEKLLWPFFIRHPELFQLEHSISIAIWPEDS